MRERIVEEYVKIKDELIKSIGELVSFESVLCEGEDGTPFGKEIDMCLDATLEICKKLGFRTYKDPEGYYGYGEIGEGQEMIGILGHLDVVPAGDLDKWVSNPFKLDIRDEKIYGRGTQDDKGPTLIALYATKAIMNTGITLNKRVRFIFGTDEENLWRCINRYMEREEKPTMGFTPDSKFPMIYAEKGLLQFNLIGPEGGVELKGGDAYNAVPDKITYKAQSKEELLKLDMALKDMKRVHEVHKDEVTVFGKSVHAAVGETGENAIKYMLNALKKIGKTNKGLEFITEEVGMDPYAENIYGVLEDEMSGKLKFNLGKIEVTDDKTILGIDIRIPVSVTKEEIVEKTKDIARKYNLEYKERDYLRSLYVPIDHFLIKTLREVYESETNFDSTPISSGGATYARSMENCVAFGAVFPDSEKTEHQPNECLSLKDMERAFIIYAMAVYKLGI